MALNIAERFLQTNSGNKYIFVAIDHYLIWVEAKAIVEHETKIPARFLENGILSKFGVPKHVLMDNQGKWATKFDQLGKFYRIDH